MSVYIIAEAGVNHNGDIELARQLIDVAASAGADAVKFQSFVAEQVVNRHAPKAAYQIIATGESESQLEMLHKLELSAADHDELVAYARKRQIEFLSTPFDLMSLRLLTERLGLDTIKIPSGEITNAPFLLAIARTRKQIILSTGMSTLGEVESALRILAFGLITPGTAMPRCGDFERAYATDIGQQSLRKTVTLLHCTSEYPAPFPEVNLRAMDSLAAAFGLPVGYSDHTLGIHISLAAVARGAKVLEKHFTLDRSLPGPDHHASLDPANLTELVHQVRDIEQALGDGVKNPTPSELKNRELVRRSLVAARELKAGDEFTEKNLACKRPGTGVSPSMYWHVLGTVAQRGYGEDELLDG